MAIQTPTDWTKNPLHTYGFLSPEEHLKTINDPKATTEKILKIMARHMNAHMGLKLYTFNFDILLNKRIISLIHDQFKSASNYAVTFASEEKTVGDKTTVPSKITIENKLIPGALKTFDISHNEFCERKTQNCGCS